MVAPACSPGSADNDEVLIFAATSLTDALDQAIANFETDRDIDILVSYGGSQALAQQIVAGAPADIFISAGKFPMDFLDMREVAMKDRTDLLSNKLVIVSEGNDIAITEMADLTGEDVRRVAMAAPDLAPAGAYAKESLNNLGLWDELQQKMVFGADVRTTMAYVESGNADVAFVYETDAATSDDLVVMDVVPVDSYSKIVYPAVLMGRSSDNEAAGSFFEYLNSKEASSHFKTRGFTILDEGGRQ